MRPGTLFFQCACINLRNEDMRFMSVELYKNVFNQALTEVRQICAPRSPRREDTDFDIRTINKLDCLNFGGKDSNRRKVVIDEAKRISVSCLQFIFCQLFEEYGYSATILQDYDTSNIRTANKDDLYFPLFSVFESKTNSVLFFKEVERDLVFIDKNFEPKYVKPIIAKAKAISYKFVYFMWDCAYLQIIGYNDDITDPGRGYNWYALKWVFITYFNEEEFLLFYKSFSRYKEIVNDFIGYISVKPLSDYSLAHFKNSIEGQILKYDYRHFLNRGEQSSFLLPPDWEKLNDQYIKNNYYLLLKGSSSFAESFITAEWLYSSMKRAKAIDLTTIGTGYFKCIEQLLFNLICLFNDKGLLIKRKNREKIFKTELTGDAIKKGEIDFSIGSMAHFSKNNINKLFRNEIGRYGKTFIKKKIFRYSDLRNNYFHKDNIHDWDKIDEIRNSTFDLLFLLIGGFKITESEVKKLGYINTKKLTDYYYLFEYIHYHAGDLFFLQFPNGSEYCVQAKPDRMYYIDEEGIIRYSGIYFDIFRGEGSMNFKEGQDDFPKTISLGKLLFSKDEKIHIILSKKKKPVFKDGIFMGTRVSVELIE